MLNKETLIESFKTVINNKLTQLVEREYSTVETMTVDETTFMLADVGYELLNNI